MTGHTGCKFYPVGENRRFERVNENLTIGSEIFRLEAHPRSEFKIEPIDNSLSDVNYFKYVDIDDRFIAIKLKQSLEDLVDRVSIRTLAATWRAAHFWGRRSWLWRNKISHTAHWPTD